MLNDKYVVVSVWHFVSLHNFRYVFLCICSKSTWLTPEDIQIDWKPLYKLSNIFLNKNSTKGEIYRYFPWVLILDDKKKTLKGYFFNVHHAWLKVIREIIDFKSKFPLYRFLVSFRWLCYCINNIFCWHRFSLILFVNIFRSLETNVLFIVQQCAPWVISLNYYSQLGIILFAVSTISINAMFLRYNCRYFPSGSTQEILNEIYPKLFPLDTGKVCGAFDLLSIFLNPLQDYDLWLNDFMNLWNTYHNPAWNVVNINFWQYNNLTIAEKYNIHAKCFVLIRHRTLWIW